MLPIDSILNIIKSSKSDEDIVAKYRNEIIVYVYSKNGLDPHLV